MHFSRLGALSLIDVKVREFARGFLTNYPVRQTGTRRQAGRGRQFPRQAHAGRQRGRSAVSCLWGNPWNKYIWEWNFWGLKSVQLASEKTYFRVKNPYSSQQINLSACYVPFSLSLASQRIQQQVIPRHSSRCAAQFNSSNFRRQVFRSNIFLSLANRP